MTVLLSISVLVNVILLAVVLTARAVYLRSQESAAANGEGSGDPREARPGFRRFVGDRHVDVTGISGEGIRIEGVRFSDGWVATHWLDLPPMREPKTEVWHNPGTEPFAKVSGHGGKTEVVWLDPA